MQEEGLYYCCTSMERFFAVMRVFTGVVERMGNVPSPRLLKNLIQCYLRLSEAPRACDSLGRCLPPELRSPAFINALRDDPVTMQKLQQLLYNVAAGHWGINPEPAGKGCDASLLLDDTSTLTGEKNAGPNRNSVRGFELIDAIKTRVEAACNATVSCADILALAARDGVFLLGGQSWKVPLGRRDARTASLSAANAQIPPPTASLSTLITMFAAKGLNAKEMTILSGGHTIGQAQCRTFRAHVYNESNINAAFARIRQRNCPATAPNGDANLAPLDLQSPNRFGNDYYKNLVGQRGLLHSDQELFNGGSQDSLVRTYARNNGAFLKDFADAMVKMGNISPLTGRKGEIRKNCRVPN